MTKKTQKELRHNSESFEDAVKYLKESCAKKKRNFNETLDIAVMLGIDPKQSTQNVKGFSVLPHGTGKAIKVIVITPSTDLQKDATASGAVKVGYEDLIAEIDSGYLDFDTCIATPDAMQKLSKVAKKLGPRGLMPNPKSGTVTNNIKEAVEEFVKGKVIFKNEKNAIIHCAIGKINFSDDNLVQNAQAFIKSIKDLKPENIKGKYMLKCYLSSTMGKSVEVLEGSNTF
jgi:large subunit ribosomal protein L1